MSFYGVAFCHCHYGIQHKSIIPDAEALKPTDLVYHEVCGRILLDDVNCTGEESQLLECGHNGIGVHDCSHYQDVGARCTGEINMVPRTFTPLSGIQCKILGAMDMMVACVPVFETARVCILRKSRSRVKIAWAYNRATRFRVETHA